MAKRRSAGNIFRHNKNGKFYARFWATVDGERMRVCRALGTDSKAVAERKLARLLATENPTPEVAAQPETFREAARRIVEKQSIKSKGDRIRRLEQVAFPCFGDRSATDVKRIDVRHALEQAAALGWAANSVKHLRVDLSTIFQELVLDDLMPANPAQGVPIPPTAKRDKRERVRLSDDEFGRLLTSEYLEAELCVMCAIARMCGGLRTSDLHELRWERIDWRANTMTVVRPKTGAESPFQIPAELRQYLLAWHYLEDGPREGYLFPVRRGPRKGQRRQGKISYAQKLRDALWAAGVRRAERREDCPLQTDNGRTRATDMHSLRRAWTDAASAAGVNAQTAMRLTGHSNLATHERYLSRSEILSVPAGMIPTGLPSLDIDFHDPAAFLEPPWRLELQTYGLRNRCSTN